MSRSKRLFEEAYERAMEAYMDEHPDADPQDAHDEIVGDVEHDIAVAEGDYADFRRDQAREEGWVQ